MAESHQNIQRQEDQTDSGLRQLLQQTQIWRGRDHGFHNRQTHGDDTVPTGYALLDKQLPTAGWPQAALTEILSDYSAQGELQLLLPMLRVLTNNQQTVALIDPPWIPYAPALAAAGIALPYLLTIGPLNLEKSVGSRKSAQSIGAPGKPEKALITSKVTTSFSDSPFTPMDYTSFSCPTNYSRLKKADQLWTLEQVLRSGHCRAVLAWPQPQLAIKTLRRLQLAAESGQVSGFLFRASSAKQQHSPAALRIHLKPLSPQKQQLDIIKCRGRHFTQPLILDLNSQQNQPHSPV